MFWFSSYLIESSPPSVDDWRLTKVEKSKSANKLSTSSSLNHRILSLICFDHLPVTVTQQVICNKFLNSQFEFVQKLCFLSLSTAEHRVVSCLVMKARSWAWPDSLVDIVSMCHRPGPFPPHHELWTDSSISYYWLTFRRNPPFSTTASGFQSPSSYSSVTVNHMNSSPRPQLQSSSSLIHVQLWLCLCC